MELRPMRLRELYDRAAGLSIRNFKTFFGIVLIVVVPITIAEYFVSAAESPRIDALLQALAHPGPAPRTTGELLGSPSDLAALVALIVGSNVLWAFAFGALAAAVAQVYVARPVAIGTSYTTALRRWPAILGSLAIALAVVVGWYGASFTLTLASAAIGLVFTVGLAAIVLSVALLFLPPIATMLAFAMCAVVVELRGPISALRLALGRIFTRQEFRRTLLLSLSMFAILLAVSTLSTLLGGIASTRAAPAAVAIESLFLAVVETFLIVLMLAYYFDVRIRREGFDLETELDRLAATVPTPRSAPDLEPVYSATRYLTGDERPLIRRFLERRDELTPDARRSLAERFAGPIRPRVPPELQGLDDESLLERL
jgi:hypothetical protein